MFKNSTKLPSSMHIADSRMRLTEDTVLEALSDHNNRSHKKKEIRFKLGLYCYFKLSQIRIPWVKQYANSIFRLHSELLGSYATTFYMGNNQWVTCDHPIRYHSKECETYEDVLRTFAALTCSPTSFAEATGEPLPEHGDKRLRNTVADKDYLIINAETKGVKPLDAEIGIHEFELVPCIMIGYQGVFKDYSDQIMASFTLVRFFKHKAKLLFPCGEEGNSGSPLFDLEGRLVGLYPSNYMIELAKDFGRYVK